MERAGSKPGRRLTGAKWHGIISHMAKIAKKISPPQRPPWETSTAREFIGQPEVWALHLPREVALRYGMLIRNLEGARFDCEEFTLETVRGSLRAGLSRVAFERLREALGVTNERLARVVHVPVRTLARRDRFMADESERILRVASAFQYVLDLMENLESARQWFLTPKRALSDHTPLEYCDSEPGAREVEHLVGRLEHGVFS